MRNNIKTAKCFHCFCTVMFITLVIITQNSYACSSFCLKNGDELVFAKNYDWYLDHGLVMVNKRNVAKTAFLLDQSDKPAKWISKYGSVTFNQYGREFPNGGINEAGLAIETLMLYETKYPNPDKRPAIMSWLQYQLDMHDSVEKVIASDSKIRVSHNTPMPIHFSLCDRDGNMATVEFVDGKMVHHKGDTLPVKVLTNDTYGKSLIHLKRHTGFGGTEEIPHGSQGSLDRFVCAANSVQKFHLDADTSIIDYAFETLASVKQGDTTKWMIVYDLKRMLINYKTLQNPALKTIRIHDFDFDSRTPVRIMSIDTTHSGLLNSYFHEYESDLNRWLIFYSFKHTEGLKSIPNQVLYLFAQYSDSTIP